MSAGAGTDDAIPPIPNPASPGPNGEEGELEGDPLGAIAASPPHAVLPEAAPALPRERDRPERIRSQTSFYESIDWRANRKK